LLKQLPCCTGDARGSKEGDPLNLVLVGKPSDVHYALARRSWHSVEKNYLLSAEKTVAASHGERSEGW
uniref:LssY C-terminal domain-containing protein n=3 Tax=Thiolapillus sp. TaxID=2017437 RepID=UPI003AF8326C